MSFEFSKKDLVLKMAYRSVCRFSFIIIIKCYSKLNCVDKNFKFKAMELHGFYKIVTRAI